MQTEEIIEIAATVRRFLIGEMDAKAFRKLYDTDPKIDRFLQAVIDYYIVNYKPFHYTTAPLYATPRDDIEYFKFPSQYPGYIYGNAPFGCVHDYLTQMFNMLTTDPRSSNGALNFYERVYIVFFQYDQEVPYCGQPYIAAYRFAQDVIPEYLSGGEAEPYIDTYIIPLFPDTMPKTARIKAIRQKIREEFRSEKGYPSWIQSCEWPLASNAKPAIYIGSKRKDGGESKEYYFRDEFTGEMITVKQFY